MREHDIRPSSLADAYPLEQAKLREAIEVFKTLPPQSGAIGLALLQDLQRRADKAAAEQNLVAMIGCFKEMQEVSL